MSGQGFHDMVGVSFADFANRTNGTDIAIEESPGKLEAVEQAFAEDPKIRAMCPRCHTIGEGTLAEITFHIEGCDATD